MERMVVTLGLNAPIRELAIAKLENARASKTTTARLASVPCAPTIALAVEFA
jgi:hypothetical protein